MLTVYLRREPTTDKRLLSWIRAGLVKLLPVHRDVVVYRDKTANEAIARYLWDMTTKPTRRFRRLHLGCAIYNIEWLEDLS